MKKKNELKKSNFYSVVYGQRKIDIDKNVTLTHKTRLSRKKIEK